VAVEQGSAGLVTRGLVVPDVILCAGCGKGLRPGQVDTWREFIALEQVGSKVRTRAKRYTGRVFCMECALPPPTGLLWEDPEPEVPGAAGNTGPVASKPLIGAKK